MITESAIDAFKRAWHEADEEGDTGNRVARGLAAVQVHATLALVEQQRIANLIALASLPNDGRDRIDGEVLELIANGLDGLVALEMTNATPFSDPDEYPRVRTDIQIALGLGGAQ